MRLPNGFGSVHKLTGNRRRPYRARVTIGWKNTNDDKRIQKYKTIGYYATKKEGIMALANFNEVPYGIDKDITFEMLYEKWSKEHYSKIVPSSKRIWIAAYRHSNYLYKKVFRNLKVMELEYTIQNATVGNPTKLRMKSLYNMMYKYAIKHEIVDRNYAVYCETPKVEAKIQREPFSEKEIEELWENRNLPVVDMILINIYSGFRPSELVQLKTKNISLAEYVMCGGLKTVSGRNRKVPIHDKILFLVSNRYNAQNEWLFVKENGEKMTYNSYAKQFKKVMQELGMHHRPHDARHTFITKAKKYKVDEYIIKIVVGHKITDITENIYTHRSFEDIRKEINKIKK